MKTWLQVYTGHTVHNVHNVYIVHTDRDTMHTVHTVHRVPTCMSAQIHVLSRFHLGHLAISLSW